MELVHNVVILGSNSSALTAALYTARANLNPLVIQIEPLISLEAKDVRKSIEQLNEQPQMIGVDFPGIIGTLLLLKYKIIFFRK